MISLTENSVLTVGRVRVSVTGLAEKAELDFWPVLVLEVINRQVKNKVSLVQMPRVSPLFVHYQQNLQVRKFGELTVTSFDAHARYETCHRSNVTHSEKNGDAHVYFFFSRKRNPNNSRQWAWAICVIVSKAGHK